MDELLAIHRLVGSLVSRGLGRDNLSFHGSALSRNLLRDFFLSLRLGSHILLGSLVLLRGLGSRLRLAPALLRSRLGLLFLNRILLFHYLLALRPDLFLLLGRSLFLLGLLLFLDSRFGLLRKIALARSATLALRFLYRFLRSGSSLGIQYRIRQILVCQFLNVLDLKPLSYRFKLLSTHLREFK